MRVLAKVVALFLITAETRAPLRIHGFDIIFDRGLFLCVHMLHSPHITPKRHSMHGKRLKQQLPYIGQHRPTPNIETIPPPLSIYSQENVLCDGLLTNK